MVKGVNERLDFVFAALADRTRTPRDRCWTRTTWDGTAAWRNSPRSSWQGRREETNVPSAQSTVTISRPVGEVFAFLADGENNRLWRPAVREIHREGGAPGVGSICRQ